MNLSSDGDGGLCHQNTIRQVSILNVFLAILKDASSFLHLRIVMTSTDEERHRRLQVTDSKLLCGIFSDSKTDFFTRDNSSCCLTNWYPDLGSGFENALYIRRFSRVPGKE